MELNLTSIIYLFFRLAPFILVSCITIGSIINSELKGFIYLIGVIFACFVSFPIINIAGQGQTDSKAPICNMVTINGFVETTTPISLVIFTYTFFYLLYPIIKYKIVSDNIFMIIFFPILILADLYWNISKGCFFSINCIIAIVCGSSIGYLWSYIISLTKLKDLQYFNVGSNREICTRPSKQKFVCTTYKNGKPVE